MVVERFALTTTEVALLAEKEALENLELLSSTSLLLDTVLEDYEQVLRLVVEACVPDFADLCAVELMEPSGNVATAAVRVNPTSELRVPDWVPAGRLCAPRGQPVIGYASPDEPAACTALRDRIGAGSMIVVPITTGELTIGWLVSAREPERRGFRPSALKVAVPLSRRIGVAIQRVTMQREMRRSSEEQTQTVRRLRRLGGAAARLAGAATPEETLRVACTEATLIYDADGAAARWWKEDGRVVSAEAGRIDPDAADRAFDAIAGQRRARGDGWRAYPMPTTDLSERAGLVVFGQRDSEDEDLFISSLASVIPIAFERAEETEAAFSHEARMRSVIESSPVALLELRTDGEVISANPAARRLFGWPSDPRSWLVPDALRPVVRDLTGDVKATRGSVNRAVSAGGYELSLSCALIPPVAGTCGETVLVAGVDLSDVRNAERALIQAQRLEAMSQVAGRVAHDFNNILTIILGYSEMLRTRLTGDHEQALIDNISAASERAAVLTRQMLGMTRHQLEPGAAVDLSASLADLHPVLTRLTGPRVPLSIARPERPVEVHLDPSEVEQILVNLVINARDAMDGRGTVDVALRVMGAATETVGAAVEPRGPVAVLTVNDTGPGMSEEVQSRCLEPFFTTKEKGRGSGLGLPTVYAIVTERGGLLTICSTRGEGTSIRIELPLLSGGDVPPADRPASGAWIGGKLSGRVLLVEDEDELRLLSERVLRGVGLEVKATSSGEEALLAIDHEGPFDILATDVMLPGMSGVDLACRARRARPSLPVVFMTGSPEALSERPDADDEVLAKPYSPEALLRRIAPLTRGA